MTVDAVPFDTELKSDYISVSLNQFLDLARQSLWQNKLLGEAILTEKNTTSQREKLIHSGKYLLLLEFCFHASPCLGTA